MRGIILRDHILPVRPRPKRLGTFGLLLEFIAGLVGLSVLAVSLVFIIAFVVLP